MRVVDYNEDFQDFSFFSNRQQKTTEFKTLATTSVSCCTLPLAASLALIWRFSFKIIQTEKSPTADTVEYMFSGLVHGALEIFTNIREIFHMSPSKGFEDIIKT